MDKFDKITAVIYYLYFHKKMFPHSVAGSHKIDDVFDYACELLMNIDSAKFEQIAKERE
jgi:hypothetical protein